MLFSMKKDQIIDMYKGTKYIDMQKINTIIFTDTGSKIGMFDKSDMILTFSPDDELVIQTERAFRKSYDENEWQRMLLASMKFGQSDEDTRGIKFSVTLNVEYVDIVKYRKEWMDWAEDTLSQAFS